MKEHYLKNLFNPKSIAVIGASNKPNSVGEKIFKNLIEGKYLGKLYPVNPKYKEIRGKNCFASVNDIPAFIDLAVIITPARTVPAIMKQCGEKGIKAAMVISAGFSETGEEGKALEKTILKITYQYRIKWIGPNCLGMMRPSLNLNATFDNNNAIAGSIALLSQSGAICAAILDWTINKQIGFSSVVSLGNSADIGFSEALDYLAHDQNTKSILLYIEGIHNGLDFIKKLKLVAGMKPVIAIKAGRNLQSSHAAQSHTGAIVGNDAVFEAALRDCGCIRVFTIEQLFSAAKVLSSNYFIKNNRLAIITNGGGAGVIAADRATELNIDISIMNENLKLKLNKILPAHWSCQNPIDIIGDATPERYHETINICMQEENIDALLVILVPIAMTQPIKVAKQIIADIRNYNKPILACWMGETQVRSSWDLFYKNNIPCFNTPENAVEAFSYLVNYQYNQKYLLETEEYKHNQSFPDLNIPSKIIADALAENRKTLTAVETKVILQKFNIPVSKTANANSSIEAVKIANLLGYPVAIKINSPDITHKQDIGGVQLNILNAEMVKKAFHSIILKAKLTYPQAKILGVSIEPMFQNSNDRELMIGIMQDKIFGPVISFGMGGSLVEVIKDYAISLPPLNEFIAKQLILRTRVAKTLTKFRGKAAINLDLLVSILVRISNMIYALPQIQEMDINPLLANDKDIIAVDARIIL